MTEYAIKLQNNLINKRWSNEIEALESEKNPDDVDLVKLLKKNIKPIKEVKKKKKKESNQNNEPQKDISSMFTSIKESVFKKPWLRLHKNHKKIKIEEYINSLEISDSKKQDKLKKLVVERVENKQLLNKNVIYSITNSKIEHIFGIAELDKYQPDYSSESSSESSSSEDDSSSKKSKRRQDSDSE